MKDAAHTPALCARFHHASELIGRRWTGAIIFVLLQKTCRFATLREAIPDITDRMLSERLQELEEEGLVERSVVPDTPVTGRVLVDQEGQGAGRRDRLDRRLGREVHRAARLQAKARRRPAR